MSYCIYIRKSRKDIEAEMQGAGETLARHRAVLTALAEHKGYSIGRIYTELGSADSIASRPVMQQLLADVQQGMWQGVLVFDVARLARGDTMDQGIVSQTFRYSTPPTLIITPDRVYDPENEADEEYFEFGLFFARREYKAITRRLQAGRIASTNEGKYVGSVHPYGYEPYKLKGEKGYSLQIVPQEAEVVRMIFNLFANGRQIVQDGQTVHQTMGANRIADYLNAMGIRTKRGNLWTPSSIRVVVHNPLYAGNVQWYTREKKIQIIDGQRQAKRPLSDKHMVVPGRHEAIVSQELWDAAQVASRGRNLSSANRSKSVINPLTGLIKCSECGHTMVRTPMYGHLAGVDYIKCPTQHCATSAAPLADVEAMILETLAGWVSTLERGQVVFPSEPSDDSASVRAALTARVEELQARRNRLMDLLEAGVYDSATYTQRMALLMKDLDAANESLAAVPVHVPTMQERLSALLPSLRHVLQAYDSAQTPEEKNKLLRSVIDRVVYHKTHRCYRNENPADFVTIEVFPK